MQYQFYKGPEKEGAWKALDVATLSQRIAKAPRIAFVTVLSVNIRPRHDESIGEDALYQGPFYVDIDSSNILKSIKAANKVLDKLNKNGIPDEAIQLWATGKKGFHFMIPMAYFAKDVPTAKLPLAYKFMALSLKLPPKETDITVYSHGRGRMWRVENKKRLDNGAYKVGITPDELREITPEKYAELCSAPREPIPVNPVPDKKIPFLQGLFKISHQRALEAVKPVQIYLDPETIGALKGKFPPCATELMQGKNVLPEKGYNEKSMQFAKAVVAFRPNEAEELVRSFAENVEADSYNTADKRYEHTMKAVKISARSQDYAWSCRSMLGVLKNKLDPCLDCPVAFLLTQQDDAIAEEAEKREAEREKRLTDKAERLRAKRATADGGLRNLGAAPVGDGNVSEVRSENESGRLIASDDEIVVTSEGSEGNASIEAPSEISSDVEAERAAHEGELADVVADLAQPSAPPPDSFDDDDDDIVVGTNTGVIGTENGYAYVDSDGEERRISNFVLKFTAVFVEYVENLEHDVRTGVKADVHIQGKKVGRVILEDTCWNSKAAFISHFSGIGHTSFFGKDEDVQKMKGTLMENIERLTENIRRVTSVGIHLTKVGDQQILTYVEPGWSINSVGMQNTFQLMGQIAASPKLKSESLPLKGDKRLTEALYALTRINSDEKIAQILGWFGACYLKQHIYSTKNQFPLIGFSGAAGSGKTSVATLFAYLHGIDYRGESAPVSLPQATSFAVWKAIKDTMTVPRIMEEYNKSKIPRNYTAYGEVFKDCWNQFAVQRGALTNSKRHGDNQIGAHLQEFPLTAPVVICSEQHVTMPALVERMIQIAFSKQDLESEGTRSFYEIAVRNRNLYRSFAKAAYMTALQITPESIAKQIEEYESFVPMEMGDRPHFSFCVLLVGLDFIKTVCKTYELDIVDRIEQLKDAIKSMVTEDILRLAVNKQRTEVDIVMDKFATMAAMSEGDGSMPWLVEHIHYLRVDNYLYLDGLVALAQYRQFMNRVENAPPVIEEISQMRALLRTEPYCDSLEFTVGPEFARGRKVWKLNLTKMAEKGIEIAAFSIGE